MLSSCRERGSQTSSARVCRKHAPREHDRMCRPARALTPAFTIGAMTPAASGAQAYIASAPGALPKAASQVRPSRAKACGMHACDPARAATPRRLGMGDHGLRVGRRARPPVWRVARCRPQDMCYPIHPCATHLMCAIGCVICEIACAISDV